MLTTGLSNAAYHASNGISKSGLDLIARSPAHYMYRAPKESTRAMEIGTAIHTALLEPERYAAEYITVDCDDRRASVYKEAIKIHPSERVLTRAESDKIAGMSASVQGNPHAQALLKHDLATTEVSIITTDPETGVPVRCRFDLLVGNRSLDLKKTQDARPDAFAKSVANYRYMVQAAFYSDVYRWETGMELEAFGFLAVEEEMPHASKIYVLDDDAIQYGRKLYRRELNLYAECLKSGVWPSVDQTPQVLSLPSWVYKEVV